MLAQHPYNRASWLLLGTLALGCHNEPSVAPSDDAVAAAAAAGDGSSASNLAANAVSSSQIDLTWQDNATNETGFEAHRSTTGASGTFSLLATTGANVAAYSDAGLIASSSYCYKVRAFRISKGKTTRTAFSATACATTAPAPESPRPPASPSEANATPPHSSTIDITWVDNSANENGFRVERSLDGGSNWATARTMSANTTSSSDYGRPSEQQHCYRVVAFNDLGESPPSNTACTTPPAPPGNLAAVAADQQTIDLTWTDNSSVEEGYEIERWVDGDGVPRRTIATLPANSTSHRDVGVTSDVTYRYVVLAKKDGGFSASSNVASAVAPTAVPTAPSQADARPLSSTSVVVTWRDNSTSKDGFRVERSSDAGTTWATVTSGTPYYFPSEFADVGRASEQQVCYRVLFFNSRGDSPPSNTDCATPPAAPTNLTVARREQGGVDLTWVDNSAVEDGYDVWFRTFCPPGYEWDADHTYLIASLPANSIAYQFPEDPYLGECRIEAYYVVARKDAGYSDPVLVAAP